MDNRQLEELAKDAYIYFYSLNTMEITRLQSIHSELVGQGAGPANAVSHLREFPAAENKTVVRLNFDTLYSPIWFDLTKGPMVMSIGENIDNRYYELPLLDMWTDVFAVPGQRSNGNAAHDWLLTPPGWTGEVPAGLQQIKAPTPYVYCIGRIQYFGKNDNSIHSFQDTLELTLFSDWLKGEKTKIIKEEKPSWLDIVTPPLEQVNAMDSKTYFNLAMRLIALHSPHYTDWSMISRLESIGIKAGGSYDSLADDVKKALELGTQEGLKQIYEAVPKLGKVENGWQMNTDTVGVYANEYLRRSAITLIGLGMNPATEAIYPLLQHDSDGDKLYGEKDYVIHFDASELPPVNAFWSITMYDKDGFQVPNELNRFSIGSVDELKYNEDGSLNIYFQHKRPTEDLVTNWLPSPENGETGITMRLYAPRFEAISHSWIPPVVSKK